MNRLLIIIGPVKIFYVSSYKSKEQRCDIYFPLERKSNSENEMILKLFKKIGDSVGKIYAGFLTRIALQVFILPWG